MTQPAPPAPTNPRRLLTVVLLGGAVIAGLLLTGEEDRPAVPQLALPEAPPNPERSPAVREIQWPELPLAVIQAHDPFRLPAWETESVVEAVSPPHPPEDKPAEPVPAPTRILEARRVSAILRTKTGTAALIEGKIYRTGDYLQEHVRIVSITAAGVTVQYEEPTAETSDQNL